MKKKTKDKQCQQNHMDDFLTNNVVSGTECTGLLQSISKGEDEGEFLREIYRLPGDGSEEPPVKVGITTHSRSKKNRDNPSQ